MRISDWSSDVCSSDLDETGRAVRTLAIIAPVAATIDAVVLAEAALAIIAVAIMVVGIPAAPVAAAISVVITIAGRGAATGEGGRGDERGEQEPVHMMSPCGCERERRQGFGQETRERRGGSRVTGDRKSTRLNSSH